MQVIHKWIPLLTVMQRRGLDSQYACEKYGSVMKYAEERCLFCANFCNCCKTVSDDHTIGTDQSYCPNTKLFEFLEGDEKIKMHY